MAEEKRARRRRPGSRSSWWARRRAARPRSPTTSRRTRPDFAYPFEYNATVGVRILECERNLGGPATPVEVWDVEARRTTGCWPAIMHDAHGVVLVYNPEQEGQVSESGAWYEYFVQNNDLPDEACVVFAFAPNAQRGTRQRVSPKIEHLNVVNIPLDDGSLVKTQFERFLKAAKARKDSGGGGGEAKGAEYNCVPLEDATGKVREREDDGGLGRIGLQRRRGGGGEDARRTSLSGHGTCIEASRAARRPSRMCNVASGA